MRDEKGDLHHPLQLRAYRSVLALMRHCDSLEMSRAEDEDLSAFVGEFQITGAKLAGALNGLAYGRDHRDGAFTVACLKRALGHLHTSQAALESLSSRQVLGADMVASYRKELFEIREEILRLMDEFRGRI